MGVNAAENELALANSDRSV
jgi:WD40 repeat protein